MQVVARGLAGDRDVDVIFDGPDPVVADLLRAIDPDAPPGAVLVVDGRPVDDDLGLDETGLVQGSIVEVDRSGVRSQAPAPCRSDGRVVAVVGGPAAGATVRLHRQAVVGRSPDTHVRLTDPTVSPHHLAMVEVGGGAVHVQELGSHNGTRVDGRPIHEAAVVEPGSIVQVGATELVVRPGQHRDRPLGLDPTRMAAGGLLAFNRPPRIALPPAPDPVRVPDPPAETRRRAAFSVATLIGPVLMGIVMVQVMGNIRFALFALMSPVMFVTNYVAARRRNAKESKSSQRQFAHELKRFEADLQRAAAAERARRETLVPDPAEVMRRAELPSTRLWERRHTDPDYLRLRIGRGPVPWIPPADPALVAQAEELAGAVAAAATIPRCPVELDLAAGGVVGLVGDRSAALALARSLVAQACVLHGPADLGVAVLTDRLHAPDWDWAKWLPHVRSPSGPSQALTTDAELSQDLMHALISADEERTGPTGLALGGPSVPGPAVLVVVDDETLTTGRRSPTRAVLRGRAGPVAGIVVASSADRLPAVCTTVVDLRDDLGDAEVVRPQLAQRIGDVTIAGLSEPTARRCARLLARYEDPEVDHAGCQIPSSVRLLPLLGLDELDADAIRAAWRRAGVDPHPATPIGVGDDGVMELDLVADGPHGLVGGTTGSGKSELLRTLVAGMAARVSPQHLVFVLVDYKGGSAFDACARLPHTVGMVTDLDAHLGERALRSLEAELHHRESVLRHHGAADLSEYLAAGAPGGAMPRLVVVVDEFATMAAELPDFMGALVGIAQRGRSLGVHMLLATQRPSGAVNANIKANTNIRIALRVQDAADSADVIDRPDAASISRANPGRAYIRLGPGEVMPVQTALSTGCSSQNTAPGVTLLPFRFGARASPAVAGAGGNPADPTDLTRLIDACCAAFAAEGSAPPRRPWLEMLPERIEHAETSAAFAPDAQLRWGAGGVVVAVADDPSNQRRVPSVWEPRSGHLALFGAVGSGTSTAAAGVVLAAASRRPADDLHIYAVDCDGGALAALAGLPHVGAVIAANERERQMHLVRYLLDEVTRRRDLAAAEREGEPQVLVVIDGTPTLLAELDGLEGQETVDALKRILAEGPGVGVAAVITADRPMAVPMRMLSSVTKRLLFKHADAGDFATIGVRARDLPTFVPGRAIDSETSLVVQVGWCEDVAGAVAALQTSGPSARPPASIDAMPVEVGLDVVQPHLRAGDPLMVPIGISERDRRVKTIALYPGDHFFVAGAARSGVSTSLRTLARLLRRAQPEAVMVAVADPRSPLRTAGERFDALGTAAELEKVLELAQLDVDRHWVIAVDDAHTVGESFGLDVLAKMPHCRLVVGGRAEQLHGQFGHWTRTVRRAGTGLLLQPRLDADGDLLGVRLPRRLSVPLVPGRGFLVANGEPTLVQVAGMDLHPAHVA